MLGNLLKIREWWAADRRFVPKEIAQLRDPFPGLASGIDQCAPTHSAAQTLAIRRSGHGLRPGTAAGLGFAQFLNFNQKGRFNQCWALPGISALPMARSVVRMSVRKLIL